MSRKRCQEMVGIGTMGANGGCGTEEKGFSSPRVQSRKQKSLCGVDLFEQARKALVEKCPFDSEEAGGSGGGTGASTSGISTLPSALAGFVKGYTDSRKRHKKSHLSAENKRPEKSRGKNIWRVTEDYFRGLRVDDIDRLYELSSFKFDSAGQKLFLISPVRKDANANGGQVSDAAKSNFGNGNGDEVRDDGKLDDRNRNGTTQVVVKEEETETKTEQMMEVDSVGATSNELLQEVPVEEESSSLPQSRWGVEWLLGSRSKLHLTSLRPTKKRKLLDGEPGVETLYVASPVQRSSSLCDYCSCGHTGNQLNRLIICISCGVAVHQRCYGVQDDEPDSWLCSWCRKGNKVNDIGRPCLLCPHTGGALKPIHKRVTESDYGGSMEFAHLFCCQWIPEVYIEDTRSMEPIMNIEGIKEARRKLVCNLCKVKHGACLQCSSGACRTSFHPICAREARLKMEIRGKIGCEDVEFRAFCSKHSEVQTSNSIQQVGDLATDAVSDSSSSMHLPFSTSGSKPHKSKLRRRNGEKLSPPRGTSDTESFKTDDKVSAEDGLSDTRSDSTFQLKQPMKIDMLENKVPEVDDNVSESLNHCLVMKKLIDGGKVDLKDVASEFGVSPDLLASNLLDDCLPPDLHHKIVKWLGNHAHIGTLQKNLKVKIKSPVLCKAGVAGVTDDRCSLRPLESDDPDDIKSVPVCQKVKSDIKMPTSITVKYLSKRSAGENGNSVRDESGGHLDEELFNFPSRESLRDATEKVSEVPFEASDNLTRNFPQNEGEPMEPWSCSRSTCVEEAANSMEKSSMKNYDHSVAMDCNLYSVSAVTETGSYIHPLIRKELKMQKWEVTIHDDDDLRDRVVRPSEASTSSAISRNQKSRSSTSAETFSKDDSQLANANNLGVIKLPLVDEVEEELVYYQHRLLNYAVARKHHSDNLIREVVKHLPHEIDAMRKQTWDAVLINQYLSELREARKQGRKERRHKEAQAVLAAATAAAAASSRISTFRKDALDESPQLENRLKLKLSSGRDGPYSHQIPRSTETLPRFGSTQVPAEQNSGSALASDFSNQHPRTCDICRRPEAILNPILVCSSCKVGVHLDCYRSVKDSAGPWYCELCEENPCHAAECGLCGGSAGAFRKCTDGQWVHAFCAEWVLESTFKRGQANHVDSMESTSKGNDTCVICSHKQGICIKCSYGHCQSTFHPYCAKSAGFYMNMRTSTGKLQHKAYCEKHSLVERSKAETQRHGIEEWNNLKKVRVELERLRLICERIIRREKLKRELVLCSHAILGSNKDSICTSARTCGPIAMPGISSESATTSLRGYSRSGSEAIQRSDDVTVDSTVAGKRRRKFPMSMENDQKTDDSSTSQLFTQRPSGRASFSGKQIPQRPTSLASQSTSEDRDKRTKFRKHTETFEKELLMTSDQAFMKNQRLPKGYVYVPSGCLSDDRETALPGTSSGEQSEHDDS